MEQFAEVAPNAMPAFAVFQLNANSNNPEIHGKGITAAQNRVHIGFTGQGADCQPVTNEPQTNAYFMDIAGLSSLYLYNDNPHQPMQAVHYDTQVGARGKVGYQDEENHPPELSWERLGWDPRHKLLTANDNERFWACKDAPTGSWTLWVALDDNTAPYGASQCEHITVQVSYPANPKPCFYTEV